MNEHRPEGLCTCYSLCQEYSPSNIYWTGPIIFRSSLNVHMFKELSHSLLHCWVFFFSFVYIFLIMLRNYLVYVLVYCLLPLLAPSPWDCELLEKVLPVILTTCAVFLFTPFHLLPTILCPTVCSEPPCWNTSASLLTFWLLVEFWPVGNPSRRLKGKGSETLECHLYSRRSLQAGCLSRLVVLNWGRY